MSFWSRVNGKVRLEEKSSTLLHLLDFEEDPSIHQQFVEYFQAGNLLSKKFDPTYSQ